MAIPNPNPNIADGIKCDNKTYSSNKIESLISTATELPIPEAGDAGKVLTVNSDADGYKLDTPVDPTSIIDDSASSSDTVYSSSKVDDIISGLDPVLRVSDTIELTLDESQSVGAGTIKDLLYNYDITSLLPSGATLKAIIVETTDTKLGIARQWVSGANKIAVSVDNATSSSVTVTKIFFKAFYI